MKRYAVMCDGSVVESPIGRWVDGDEAEAMKQRLEEATWLLRLALPLFRETDRYDLEDSAEAFLSGAPAREADIPPEEQGLAGLQAASEAAYETYRYSAVEVLHVTETALKAAESTLAAVRAVVDWGQCACCQHLRGVLRTHAPAPGEEGA